MHLIWLENGPSADPSAKLHLFLPKSLEFPGFLEK
jgi:hypothetical protein